MLHYTTLFRSAIGRVVRRIENSKRQSVQREAELNAAIAAQRARLLELEEPCALRRDRRVQLRLALHALALRILDPPHDPANCRPEERRVVQHQKKCSLTTLCGQELT